MAKKPKESIEFPNQKVIPVEVVKEMKKSYIDYAMSVIVGRALPDARDGLKPVHRRILYTMYEDNFTPDKPYRKCATTVGDVLGRYHPHGDAAVYDSLVRMAQDFSMRYPLIDGHGNFGSVDGDGAAAYRYTEARMSKLAMEMLRDIEKETVNWAPNFDERLKEPMVIPSRYPNLLVNGSSGIAVGMATNIPPHSLKETIDGCVALIDNPDITIDELMTHIKGPDFPTHGMIMGRAGIRAAYHTGRGKITIRSRAVIEEENGRNRIIVTEIPYQVNKARLIEKMAELVHEKRLEGISDLRDESDRDGMRIVIELKRDANANVVLNRLYQYTSMQETFSINMIALVNNQPKLLNLKDMLNVYVAFQKEVIIRRTEYERRKAQERAHILEGLKIALDNIDEVIRIIRSSYNNAKQNLMERFGFSDRQAQAILDMRLARLQGLEREKIEEELRGLLELIEYLTMVLGSEEMIFGIIKEEMLGISEKFGDDRRTEILHNPNELDIEDLIEDTTSVVTMTRFGYTKRTTLDTYRAQRRGGRGVTGLNIKEEDFVENLFICNAHAHILFFTNLGRMYRLKAYEIPEAGRTAKGTAIVNLLQLQGEEKVTATVVVPDFQAALYLNMLTKKGVIKRSSLSVFANIRKSGIAAINIDEGDELIFVKVTDGTRDMLIATRNGKAMRYNESAVRVMGRSARGVRGITLRGDDEVIGYSYLRDDGELLSITENGFGKRTALSEYKCQTRGGIGLTNYNISEKTGKVACIKVVTENDDIILITSEGTIIRTDSWAINKAHRVTKGVRVMRMEDGVKIIGIARFEREDDEEAEISDEIINEADEMDTADEIVTDEGEEVIENDEA